MTNEDVRLHFLGSSPLTVTYLYDHIRMSLIAS